jgi:hypothetical protein
MRAFVAARVAVFIRFFVSFAYRWSMVDLGLELQLRFEPPLDAGNRRRIDGGGALAEHRQRRAQQRHPIPARRHQLLHANDLVQLLPRRRHRRHGLDGDGGRGHQRQVERRLFAGAAEPHDRAVDQGHDVADVVLPIAVMGARPLGQRAARLLGEGQRTRPVGGERHVVEDRGHVVGEPLVVGFRASCELLVTRRRGVLVGPLPVDEGRGQADRVQARLVVGSARRQREDHVVLDAGELAVGHDRRAVDEEQAEQRRLRRRRRRRHGGAEHQGGDQPRQLRH